MLIRNKLFIYDSDKAVSLGEFPISDFQTKTSILKFIFCIYNISLILIFKGGYHEANFFE